MLRLFILVVVSGGALFANAFSASAEPPKVVVTLRPLHSLVSMAMEGIATPELLLNGAQDPHHFSLKPSQARMLGAAQIVFYQDPGFEVFLSSLRDSEGPTRYIALSEGVEKHDQHHEDHLWLSPLYGKQMLSFIVKTLIAADPENTRRYQLNEQRFQREIEKDSQLWRSKIFPLTRAGKAIASDIDVLQPLTTFLALPAPTPLMNHHSTGISWAHLKELEEQKTPPACILLTHFTRDSLQELGKRTHLPIIEVDILGRRHLSGSTLYLQLMADMVRQIRRCLI